MARAKIIARKATNPEFRTINIQVRHGSERKMRKLDIKIEAVYWDEKRLQVKDRHRDAFEHNTKISLYEQTFNKAVRKAEKLYRDVSLDNIIKEWDVLIDERKRVDVGDCVATEFAAYVAKSVTKKAGYDQQTIKSYKLTVAYLEGYVFDCGGRMSVAKFAALKEFIAFGSWLKEEREVHASTRVFKKNGLMEASVVSYLMKFFKFFKEQKELGVLAKYPSNKEVKAVFNGVEEFEKYILSEDMVKAIFDTQVDFEVNGKKNSKLFNERILLDTLKLIVGHGFRYSDLISMAKTNENIKSEVNSEGEQEYFFKFDSPKTVVANVEVPFYPGTKEILDFWADRPERKYVVELARLPNALRETALGKNFKITDMERNITTTNKTAVAVHVNPMIPYGPAALTGSRIRKRLYEKIQMTWLINKYGTEWQQHRNDADGFMEIIYRTTGSGTKEKRFYETLSYHFGRHTFISRAINIFGLPTPYVQKMVGHARLATTELYVRSDKKEMKQRLNAAYKQHVEPKVSQLRKAV